MLLTFGETVECEEQMVRVAKFSCSVKEVVRVGPKPTKWERKKLDILFAKAIFHTSSAFSLFGDPNLRILFPALGPAWKPPRRTRLGRQLLSKKYECLMQEMIKAARSLSCVTITADSAALATEKMP